MTPRRLKEDLMNHASTMCNPKYSTSRGLFVGMTSLDFVYYLDRFPDNNSKARTRNYQRYVGGPAANAAITYAALGGRATLITCLGTNHEEALIRNILDQYGVSVINCAKDNKMPNMSTIAVDTLGNRTILSGQTLYEEIEFPEPGEAAFCLFDLNQQELALPILERVSCPVVLDAGSWKGRTEAFLEQADIVISSEQFRDPAGKILFEIEACSGALKAMTRGAGDILTEQGTIPVDHSAAVVDTLAAGDIFHGAFCYGFYNLRKSFDDALRFAAGIATESVKYAGPRAWITKHTGEQTN